MSKYHGQTAQFIAAVAQNVPEVSGEMMQYWIENPLKLQGVLAGLGRMPCPESKVFKTIKLGTGLKTADDFRKALKDGGFRISDWASDILGKPAFKTAAEKTEVNLVVVSVAELGFKQAARRDQIYDRAKEFGLQLCPPEVGPQLRLQYRDQPLNEWLFIGMEPIADSDGFLRAFDVLHDGDGLWLHCCCGLPDDLWYSGSRWVFLRGK